AGVADGRMARRAPAEPPAGMMLVARPDGSPWLYVDIEPVSLERFAADFPDQKTLHRSRRRNQVPVVDVAFAAAEAHAAALDKRLLTPEEWAAAETVLGWQSAGELWEWVDDGTRGAQARRPVRATGGQE